MMATQQGTSQVSSTIIPNYSDVSTHSFLLSNLHCPSCVSHIHEVLSTLHPAPVSVSPSLVTSWVTVEHQNYLSVTDIREAFKNAGFGVVDVTPEDHSEILGEVGGRDRFEARFCLEKRAGIDTKCEPSERHLANCQACRLEAERKDARSSAAPQGPSNDPMFGEVESKEALVVVDSIDFRDTWRASLAIGGMTCAVCSNAITEELLKRNWIQKVSVNLISNSATVDFVGEERKGDVVEAIEDLGYDATIDDVLELKTLEVALPISHDAIRCVELRVHGMFCENCPLRIQTSLKAFGDRVTVEKAMSLVDPVLRIKYIPSAPDFTIRDIIKAINDSDRDGDGSFQASIFHPPTLEERSRLVHQKERQRIAIRVGLTFVCAVPTLIIGIIFMSLVPTTNSGRTYLMSPLVAGVSRSQWALFILATPVYFYCANVFHIRAIKELRALWRPGSSIPMLQRFYRFGSMNLLMSLGTSISYISSVAQLIAAGVHPPLVPDNTTFYFDSVVFLTLFLLAGRLVEAFSKSKTGDAVTKLGELRPTEALLVETGPSTGSILTGEQLVNTTKEESVKSVSADLLEYGDIVKVPHGASPPCDGTIVQGTSKFDESSLTGESKLITKAVGDQVLSGTVNKDSPVTIRITGVAGSSMLDQIVKAVREGQTRRAPIERIADTLTGYFVPLVTLIAIVTWIVWLGLGYSVRWSLQYAIAVFVVACPCGLGLAAPTALFVGGGLAAKYGILVKGGGEAFEKASGLDCIVFDKTGTLTLGEEPAVTKAERFPTEIGCQATKESIMSMIATIENSSNHPIARAIRSYAKFVSFDTQFETEDVVEIPGKGMKGIFLVSGTRVGIIIGNEGLMSDCGVDINTNFKDRLNMWKSEGDSVALAAVTFVLDAPVHRNSSRDAPLVDNKQWQLTAAFAISDPIRPESPRIIAELKKRGLQVWMLSGDNQITANAVGAQVGIPIENIIAGILPSEKAEKIKYLQQSLKSRRTLFGGEHTQNRALVAMVGDGINDSPALATADVGIAIGSGSDIAISSAEFVLISSNLNTLLTLLDLSRVVFRRIKFNFAWALIYNLIALPVAAGVFYPIKSKGEHVRLDPVWASLAMALSSISVVLSSLALRSNIPGVGFKAKKIVGDRGDTK